MTKTSVQAAQALTLGKDFYNSCTNVEDNTMFHYGEIIARKRHGKIFINMAGSNSGKIVERLSALPGVKIERCGGHLFLNGKVWDGKEIEI